MMVLSYGLYIIFMIYNARILQMCSAPKVSRHLVFISHDGARGFSMHAELAKLTPQGSTIRLERRGNRV